jgi:hypothetical protein
MDGSENEQQEEDEERAAMRIRRANQRTRQMNRSPLAPTSTTGSDAVSNGIERFLNGYIDQCVRAYMSRQCVLQSMRAGRTVPPFRTVFDGPLWYTDADDQRNPDHVSTIKMVLVSSLAQRLLLRTAPDDDSRRKAYLLFAKDQAH